MTVGQTIFPGKSQFFDDNGDPLSLGTVTFYVPGTTTLKTTWSDSAATVPNANPLTLDAAGRAIIYGVGDYRQIVKNAAGTTLYDVVVSPGDWLDAETLDGQEGAYYLDPANLTGTIPDAKLPSSMANKTFTGTTVIGGGTPWTSANDGVGSTLDAGLLGGIAAADTKMKFISSHVMTLVGSELDLDIEGYDEVMLLFVSVSPAVAENFLMRFSPDGTTFPSTGYQSGIGEINGSPGSATNTTGIQLNRGGANARVYRGVIRITGISTAGAPTMVTSTLFDDTDNIFVASGYNVTSQIEEKLRLLLSGGGNFDAGTVFLWGRK